MPLPPSDCEIPSDVVCHSWYDAVSGIVGIAHAAIVPQLNVADCDRFVGYVTVGEPNNPVGDYVAGWVVSLDPRGRNQQFPMASLTVGVRIMETGWPMVNEDGSGSVPTFEELNAVALHSFSHAESAMRAVYNALRTRQLACCGSFTSMGPTVPVRPSGGLTGWQFTVTVDLDW